MLMPKTQANSAVAVTTPLGDDVLILRSMSGSDQLGRPYTYNLDLFSEQPDKVKFDKILGEKMTVLLKLPSGQTRYFNGHVSRFVQAGVESDRVYYQATLVPWLWFLTRTADCRIFQKMTVPDIIKQVFRDLKFSDFEEALKNKPYRTWDYCVQYRETAFNFVNRLMEQEGIYYYFKHEQDKHTLVMADSPSSHEPLPGYDTIRFLPPSGGRSDGEFISTWTVEHQYQPGKYALTDYNFENPNGDLQARQNTLIQVPGVDQYEIFDYPGEYTEAGDGTNYTRVRMEELEAQFKVFSGASDVRGITSGYTFTMANFPVEDQNQPYLVTSVSYHVEAADFTSGGGGGGTLFSCGLTAIPADLQYRSPMTTPKPVVQGPQTAVVVGASGEEIHTDEYGRIKVQFHWDRYGKLNQDSSCWIRVSQIWAGKNWGSLFIPRIDQEVIVEFLEGDPDRPIVTGSVYNKTHMPPYSLPGEKHLSGIKSDSIKGKGAGNNEIKFDDSKDKENVACHSQFNDNTTIGNDRNTTIGNNQTLSVAVDDTEEVGGNQTVSVTGNQDTTITGNHTNTVSGNETIAVTGNQDTTVSSNQNTTVTSMHTLTVGINSAETIGAAKELTVGGLMNHAVGAAYMIEVGAAMIEAVGAVKSTTVGASMTQDVAKGYTLKAKTVLIDAKDSITLKTGEASITMKKNGDITIKGKNITVKGTGKINAKADKNMILKGKKILEN